MSTDLLTAYARLWGLQQLSTTGLIKMLAAAASLSGEGLVLSNVKATMYVLPAPLQVAYIAMVLSLFVLPRVPAWSLLALHVMHMALHYSRLPEIWNSEFWDGLVETCVLLVGAVGLAMWRQPLSTSSSSSLSFSDWLMTHSAPPARATFIALYGLTVLFKLTSSFLDPAISCAPLFPMALLENAYPTSLPDPPLPLLRFVVGASPAATVLIEALVPIALLAAPWRVGVGVGVFFHWLIAMTPPPNNAGGFSCGVLARYYFFAPEACARAFRTPPSARFAAAAAATVAYTIVLGVRRNGDWGVVIAQGARVAPAPNARATIR